jgi:hypothetical protein
MLDWLLSEFSKQYAISIPEKDKKGFYSFQFAQFKHPIIIQDLNPGVFFFSRLLPLPILKEREQFFIHIMKANFLGQGTGGSVLGLERDQKFLTLSLTLTYEVNYPIFREKLEDFLNYIEYWIEEIAAFKQRSQ